MSAEHKQSTMTHCLEYQTVELIIYLLEKILQKKAWFLSKTNNKRGRINSMNINSCPRAYLSFVMATAPFFYSLL